jgi:phage tail-like protein
MPNRRDFDHIGAFNFNIEIEGVTSGPAIHVDGLGGLTDVIRSRNGSDRTQRLRPGRSRCSNVTIQRGYNNNDELLSWYFATRDGKLQRKAGSVILLGDDAETEICRFNFFEAWPCRWELLPLNADDGALLVEEIELVVERIEKG